MPQSRKRRKARTTASSFCSGDIPFQLGRPHRATIPTPHSATCESGFLQRGYSPYSTLAMHHGLQRLSASQRPLCCSVTPRRTGMLCSLINGTRYHLRCNSPSTRQTPTPTSCPTSAVLPPSPPLKRPYPSFRITQHPAKTLPTVSLRQPRLPNPHRRTGGGGGGGPPPPPPPPPAPPPPPPRGGGGGGGGPLSPPPPLPAEAQLAIQVEQGREKSEKD
ncbi:hypothetical protein LZ31DRAFT_146222 [Colletotrichum somersetense]|nr:hypothetical protein LZ31DRAFT_146222 [Colletotrichum somersetense]